MKKLVFTTVFILLVIFSCTHEETPLSNEIPQDNRVISNREIGTIVYENSSIEPEFPGGADEMATFIQETFYYPEISREKGEQGTVWVEFVVYSDGAVKDVKVVKGVSPALDNEAKRVIKAMPKWIPGVQDGKPVNVRYTIPIKARLG